MLPAGSVQAASLVAAAFYCRSNAEHYTAVALTIGSQIYYYSRAQSEIAL